MFQHICASSAYVLQGFSDLDLELDTHRTLLGDPDVLRLYICKSQSSVRRKRLSEVPYATVVETSSKQASKTPPFTTVYDCLKLLRETRNRAKLAADTTTTWSPLSWWLARWSRNQTEHQAYRGGKFRSLPGPCQPSHPSTISVAQHWPRSGGDCRFC